MMAPIFSLIDTLSSVQSVLELNREQLEVGSGFLGKQPAIGWPLTSRIVVEVASA
jgi:hypothetical protein